MSRHLLILCKGDVMNPYVPTSKCSAIVASYKIADSLEKFLSKYDIEVIPTIKNQNLPSPIDDHADLSLHLLSEDKLLVEKSLFDYYSSKLSKYKIDIISSQSSLSNSYPNDCLLNVGRISNYYIHNDIIDGILKSYFDKRNISHIFVKQGYSKCSILNVNYDTIITQDMGIHKKLLEYGLKTFLLPAGHITLEGYNTGFIGGCGGLISNEIMLLSGNPKTYYYGDKLTSILQEKGLDIIYPQLPFKDIGSIIPIKE